MDYLYGKLNEKDMLKYSDALFFAADRYSITGLEEHYDIRLFQEVLLGDRLLKHLRNSELHQLASLRRYYLSLLFAFGKIHDIKSDDIDSFLDRASHEMVIDIFKHLLKVFNE